MNNLFIFEGKPLRVIDREGEPWFVLADVCSILGLSNTSMVANRLGKDEKQILSLHGWGRGNSNVNAVSRSGLYNLTLTSRKEAAKRFKKWIASEVLSKPKINLAVAREARLSFRHYLGIARELGQADNEAVLSANRAMTKILGVDVLSNLGLGALLTPAEIGVKLAMPATVVDYLLQVLGYQTEAHEPTEKGLTAGGVLTGDHQLRWPPSILDVLANAVPAGTA